MGRIRRALISVSDKTGLEDFAGGLARLGVEVISTGGTAAALRKSGISVTDVSEITGFPEIMDGRVKTLHPKVHGGLLALRDKASHVDAMRENGIGPIDLLAVNLYPFEATLEKRAGYDELVENIDIGGPAMVRAAAKNHRHVTVIVDPADYGPVLDEMHGGDCATTPDLRKRLAAKAFARTAAYDSAVSTWLLGETGTAADATWRAFGGQCLQTLRYGENPHQWAAFLGSGARTGLAGARQLQGKELSYNNIADTDAALECVAEFDAADQAACVIVKHANPCGVAVASTQLEAYLNALRCDPVSAFGGIIAFNRPLEGATAEEIVKLFTEVIVAPDAGEDAVRLLAERKNLRLLLPVEMPHPGAKGLMIRSVNGGFLVQSRDNCTFSGNELRVVTKRHPNTRELADLKFAFIVAKHVKSNAIVYARDGATVGIGAGQMSRLDSSRIAARKSADAAQACGAGKPLAEGSVVASDAFFPFPDGLLAAAEAGATAVIQPGGSARDDEVIAAADEAGLAMIFTGIRHFRH